MADQWAAKVLIEAMQTDFGISNDDLPSSGSTMATILAYADTPTGKELISKITNPALLYTGDIVIPDANVDLAFVVLEGAAVSANYKVSEINSAKRKFIFKEKTGPVAYVIRGGSGQGGDQLGATNDPIKSRILQITRTMWNSKKSGEALPSMFVCGIRGFFNTDKNKRNVYDDAICVISTDNVFAVYKANVDPSGFTKGVASLLPGVHVYKPGLHGIKKGNPYPAFIPATAGKIVPVTREGSQIVTTGSALNIHRGGNSTTSSLGCQTIQPSQWDQFYSLVRSQMAKVGFTEFYYILSHSA